MCDLLLLRLAGIMGSRYFRYERLSWESIADSRRYQEAVEQRSVPLVLAQGNQDGICRAED